jgi:hypothetical protein
MSELGLAREARSERHELVARPGCLDLPGATCQIDGVLQFPDEIRPGHPQNLRHVLANQSQNSMRQWPGITPAAVGSGFYMGCSFAPNQKGMPPITPAAENDYLPPGAHFA